MKNSIAEATVWISLEELELHRIVVSKTYAADQLDYLGAEFRQCGSLKVNADAELAGAEIRIRGHLGTRLAATCDRCLGPVEFPVERDFDLVYRPLGSIAREEEIEISPEELEVGFYSGNGIALGDVLTEQVILAFPMKVTCRDDCRGLCPVCGANLNVKTCECPKPKSDSPFASLK